MRASQILIDRARMRDSFFNGRFSDLMEDDALRLLQAGDLLDVPSNSFALAVGVGCEEYLVGFCGSALYLLDHVALVG